MGLEPQPLHKGIVPRSDAGLKLTFIKYGDKNVVAKQ